MPYLPISLSSAGPLGRLPMRYGGERPRVTADQPAVLAMTDFTEQPPVTVDAGRHIDDALQDMIHAGVRALIVVRQDAVAGLITSYDIQGEKPVVFLNEACAHDSCRHQDVLVGDILTPWELAPKISYDALCSHRIGDLAKTFERNPEIMHLLVTQAGPAGTSTLRGIVSRTHLDRVLK